MPQFELEFYADASGDQPVLRWLREELSPTQRRAIGVAMAEILQKEGIGVCRGAYGSSSATDCSSFGCDTTPPRSCARSAGPRGMSRDVSASCWRVFCHAHGDRLILLLAGYDKGADPSRTRQQREITEARRRLADYRRRARRA
jgi:hypothetical protein